MKTAIGFPGFSFFSPRAGSGLGRLRWACLMVLGGSAAFAEPAEEPLNSEAEADAVIVSEELTPRLTFANPGGGSAVFYGQFNPVYQWFDDGEETTAGVVDNANWNSRLGFRIAQPVSDNRLRFRFETALGLRSSAGVSQEFEPDWMNWQRTALRWFESAYDTKGGTFSAGQGSQASDGTASLDESFTLHAGTAESRDGFGAFRFRDGNGQLTDVTVGAVNDHFEGARRFRLRYDSPRFAGLTLSSSYGRNILVSGDDRDYSDVAIRSAHEVGDFSLQTAAGYGWENNPDGENLERIAGSATLLHNPSGLNLAVAAGARINGPDYTYTRAGWRKRLLDCGPTSLSVDYYRGSDFLSHGARTENVGLYAVQSVTPFSLDVYVGWRRFTYSDRLGGSYQDADSLLAGTRWFF